jgi:hypothetical protein
MSPRRIAATLALCAVALVQAPGARAQSCKARPASGPVSLLILDSARKVDEFAATPRGATPIVRERGIVIFEDGRVVTSDVDAATEHLNGLGWGARPIQIVASFPLRPNPPPGGG